MNVPLLFEYRAGWDVSGLGATFARAGVAAYRDSNGVAASAAAAALRGSAYALNPVTGLYERTTQLELSSDNGFVRSAEFDNASWTKTNSTVVADAITAPDGTVTADKIVEDGTASIHTVNQALSAPTDNTKQTTSVFAKAGERTWLLVRTLRKDGTQINSFVDLANGVTGTVNAAHAIALVPYINGWFQVIVTWDCLAGGGAVQLKLGPTTGDLVSSYAGDGASGIYLWAAQHDKDKDFVTSYIATAGATATRVADALQFPISFVPQLLTLYVKFIERGSISTLAGGGQRILQIAANAQARIQVQNVGGFYRASHNNGIAATVNSTLATAPTVGQLVELRITLGSDGKIQINQSINGGAETTAALSGPAALAASWGSPTLYVNQDHAGANMGNIALQVIRFASGNQSLATMRTPATFIQFTDSFGTAFLSNEKPFPADRFSNWTPDSGPFGDSANRQSDGLPTMVRLRDDYAVHLELAKIPSRAASNPAAADIADRLRYHLMNAGTCFVATGDALGSGYGPMCLRPGTKLGFQQSDRRSLEYTFTADLLSVGATPVRASAYYAEQ